MTLSQLGQIIFDLAVQSTPITEGLHNATDTKLITFSGNVNHYLVY
jgi:hypothetical protein